MESGAKLSVYAMLDKIMLALLAVTSFLRVLAGGSFDVCCDILAHAIFSD
jgi:hypothetical protein